MKASIAIPARLGSTRLAQKMLADIGGKPLLKHVVDRVKQVRNCREIFVLTDAPSIMEMASAWDVNVLFTSPECRSGSERIASALPHMAGDWIFNVQGDEPFVDPILIESLITASQKTNADLLTPIFKIQTHEELLSQNVVKVVLDNHGHALYFSRSPIPCVRDFEKEQWLEKHVFWGHIGIYGYQRKVLEGYARLPKCDLETAESLEQLRFLAEGYSIATQVTDYRPVAVDTFADLAKARLLYAQN